MSPLFLKQFTSQNKCPCCRYDKLEGYSLCARHLQKAKLRFRSWSKARRKAQLCCYCDNKSFNGFLRCETHTKLNREKCKAWCATHKEQLANNLRQLRELYRSQGRCFKCKPHRRLRKGLLNCWHCTKRSLLYNRGIKLPKTATTQAVKLALKSLGLTIS